MDYQNLVRDYTQRTLKNLEIIEKIANGDAHLYFPNSSGEIDIEETQAFEVTQLVNSMLGLIILPQQRYFDSIPETPLSELRDWPKPLLEGDKPEDLHTLKDLMRYIRNSIAHFNIEFLSSDDQRINGIKIWNLNRQGKKNWTALISLYDLRDISEKFIELMLEKTSKP